MGNGTLPPIANSSLTKSQSAPNVSRHAVDPMELAQAQSKNRVAAIKNKLEGEYEERVYLLESQKLRSMKLQREAEVQSALERDMQKGPLADARKLLCSSTGSLKTAKPTGRKQLAPIATQTQKQEAVRETARDSIRREKVSQLASIAYRENERTGRLEEETEHLRKQHTQMVEAKRQAEEEIMANKRHQYELGHQERAKNDAEKAELLAKIAKVRSARDREVEAISFKRREAKEAKKVADAKAADRKTEEMTQFYQRRAQAKARDKEIVTAEKALEESRRLELVYNEAETAVARAQQALDQNNLREQKGAQVDAGEGERLQRKLEKARAIATKAKSNYEEKLEAAEKLEAQQST